jgi:hypothetical protein
MKFKIRKDSETFSNSLGYPKASSPGGGSGSRGPDGVPAGGSGSRGPGARW